MNVGEVKPPASGKNWLTDWAPHPETGQNLDVLDGIRGLAILMVVACHFADHHPKNAVGRFVVATLGAGNMGVPLFFALSGFLVARPFWRQKLKGTDAPALPSGYARRRFWKIYPPLALSILVWLPFYYFQEGNFQYVELAGQWLTGMAFFQSHVSSLFNPVMWSLIVEVHFYMVLPLVFLALKRVSFARGLWVVFLLFLVVPTVYRIWQICEANRFSSHPQIHVLFPSQLDAFALGILLAGWEAGGQLPRGWARAGDVGLALWVLLLPLTGWLESLRYFGMDPQWAGELKRWAFQAASALLLFYAADPQHPRARLLSAPGLRWCGFISFEWYLFHQPVNLWMTGVLERQETSAGVKFLVLAGVFALGLGLAVVVYRFFSLPILKWSRRRPHPLN